MLHLLAYLPLMSIWSGCLKVCRLLALSRRLVSLSRVLTLPFRLENYLIYKQLHHHREKIQVGMFLATGYLEEVRAMTDSHFPASNRTIMVVDDNPDIVDILRITLESKGFNVRCAYSGQELFAGLEKQKPDLIILDIIMPKMDGLQVLRRLKEDPSMPFIPVILLTEKADDEDVDEDVMLGYKMGADYYITKPFTLTQVLDGINFVLGGDQSRSVESL